MLVVPRASTHVEFTDIPLVLPASRYGQALTSVYVQRWLDRYLKHRSAAPLLRVSFRYLEPAGNGEVARGDAAARPAAQLLLLLGVRVPGRRPAAPGPGPQRCGLLTSTLTSPR